VSNLKLFIFSFIILAIQFGLACSTDNLTDVTRYIGSIFSPIQISIIPTYIFLGISKKPYSDIHVW